MRAKRRRLLQLLAFAVVVVAAILSYNRANDAATDAHDAANKAQHAAKVAQHTANHNTRLAKTAKALAARIERESVYRRDQACRGLELGHRQEVKDLRRTYDFYAKPPPSFADLLDNPLVLDGLRDDIKDAAKDQDQFGVFVPKYCDAPGIGLKEPDPIVPKVPERVRIALDMATP